MIGAAAVVSIYAAGYERTRSAADRLAEEDAAHQRPAPVERVPLVPVDTARAVSAVAAVARETARETTVVVPKAAKVKAAPTPKDTVAVAVAVPVAVPVATDTAAASAPAPVPAPTAPAPAVVAPKWRDGTFSGWGNSRHGSIEATVTIKNGRITDAYISRCETRYSCSWIEHLQIQVVDRQSPEVDFVSGATQSVNAFYYAVVEALTAAKAP